MLGCRCVAKHLRGRRLIESQRLAHLLLSLTANLQQTFDAKAVNVHGVLRDLEGDADMRLGPKIVDLIWLRRCDDTPQGRAISEVAKVKEEPRPFFVGVAV